MNDNNLKVVELLAKSDPKRINAFNGSIQSSYSISSNKEKCEVNFEWLELMEDTIRYIDNILRNPNRFIVNEEEVVNVEKARRITVESIKHLSRHTSFIQKIEKGGNVKPSKILNINKDENYNTYENRVIYTLIKNMQAFIAMRKNDLVTASYEKNNKKTEYHGVARIGRDNVNIDVAMTSRSNSSETYGRGNDLTVEERIEKLELHISDLTNTNVFKLLKKENVARVVPPIKKTNLILKNTNFQYAMKLWNFLQSYQENGSKATKESIVYKDDKECKNMFDDVFLLNYLIADNVEGGKKEKLPKEKNTEIVNMITDRLITKIVEINSDLPMTELEKRIGDRIAVVRNKKEASIEEVQKKFNTNIQSAISKIVNYKFRS